MTLWDDIASFYKNCSGDVSPNPTVGLKTGQAGSQQSRELTWTALTRVTVSLPSLQLFAGLEPVKENAARGQLLSKDPYTQRERIYQVHHKDS